MVLGVLAMAATTPHWGASQASLLLTGNAARFRALLLHDWAPTGAALKDIAGFPMLRANLLLDSLLVVPAYCGLLVFVTLALGPAANRYPSLRQWLCVPAVAAGLFDIAENGMTGHALDELMHARLVDESVADITLASRLKWALLAVALVVVVWRAWRWRRGPGIRSALAPLACALAAAAFGVAAWFSLAQAVSIGLVAALVGVGTLVRSMATQRSATPPRAEFGARSHE
ncbi:MAG: hypothetical protein JSR59_23190 [Proteobacteria bacterium]|nr:hypothetical protein [Pseudomonadota bacterium]